MGGTCGTSRVEERCIEGLVGKLEAKGPIGISRCSREDNMKINHKKSS